MSHKVIVKGELRAYIQWEGKWRHVYILSSFDQMTLLGDPVRMLNFKLTKRSPAVHASEKMHFHKNKPRTQKARGGDLV